MGFFKLQWGHRLSAVETRRMAAIIAHIMPELQWGHRLSAVETCGPIYDHFIALPASMGPPSFGGGNSLKRKSKL